MISDFIATSATPVLYEDEDPFRFYLACDDSNLPDWETAQKHLKPKRGIVAVEMLPAPSRIGRIYLPSVAMETRVDDEAVAGFESSVGIVIAVGEGVALSPGDRVLCVDGDGCELQAFYAGEYKARGYVRFYGITQPAEDDHFTLPFKGYVEELPWDESVTALIEGDMIRPTGTNVLIRKDPFEHAKGLLLLPDTGIERPSLATVEGVGPDCTETSVGDRILFHPEGELSFYDSDLDLRMIRELAILTAIEEAEA